MGRPRPGAKACTPPVRIDGVAAVTARLGATVRARRAARPPPVGADEANGRSGRFPVGEPARRVHAGSAVPHRRERPTEPGFPASQPASEDHPAGPPGTTRCNCVAHVPALPPTRSSRTVAAERIAARPCGSHSIATAVSRRSTLVDGVRRPPASTAGDLAAGSPRRRHRWPRAAATSASAERPGPTTSTSRVATASAARSPRAGSAPARRPRRRASRRSAPSRTGPGCSPSGSRCGSSSKTSGSRPRRRRPWRRARTAPIGGTSTST